MIILYRIKSLIHLLSAQNFQNKWRLPSEQPSNQDGVYVMLASCYEQYLYTDKNTCIALISKLTSTLKMATAVLTVKPPRWRKCNASFML